MSADVIPCVMPAPEAVAPTLAGALPLDMMSIANDDNSDSELSELEMDGTNVRRAPATPKVEEAKADVPNEASEVPKDDTPVEPHHWDDGVPVFKPTMKEFEPFEEFMNKVNQYGMQTGIIKVIPPKEWLDEQPVLDEIVKGIKAPNPIIQEIMADGNRDGYRILNLQHPKTYNLPGWGKLCQRPEHQPPARRGERRAQVEKPKRGSRMKKEEAKEEAEAEDSSATAQNSGPAAKKQKVDKDGKSTGEEDKDRLPTPTSPSTKPADAKDPVKAEPVEPKMPKTSRSGRGGGRMGRGGSTATSVSSRRKNASRGEAGKINEADFVDFEYKLDISDYTPERCAELERAYWKTLTYAPPLYGADMLGSLFDEKTTAWNLGNLPNLLDVMGTKIPGVNTAYLYLGMWKATFAWHLEDVDLYSINYLHFGAPKQWYSISQKDARKFEAAMASIWPQDAKACDQFLRHKTFLISPSTLLNKYGVKVNRTTHYPGEFVVTYPYGYHSGFNMGYNCAEAVNFALPSWLEMGRIAKKCDCEQAQDSVWIDVAEIERKMRGEETEFEDSDEEEEEEDEDGPTDLPTPPESSGDNKLKKPARKRIRNRVPAAKRGTEANKELRVRLKTHVEPCCLCPNDIKGQHLLPTDDGRKAHRICAEYTPETEIENGMVYGVSAINKDRLDLKCIFCRSRKGAKIQCSQKKCVRSYHATCAAAAGMFVEQADVPVFGEDGTEYKTPGCEFSCRFHRAKRDKKLTSKSLEKDETIQASAATLKSHEICQFQLPQKDIFAGLILENRKSEGTLLIEVLPSGENFEIEYKYLLLAHPSDYHLEKPSTNALPLPKSRQAKDALNTTNRKADDLPRKDDIFLEGYTWAEFVNFDLPKNPEQVNVDFSKEKQVLYYLGDISKESSACYTADHTKPVHDHSVSFLNTIPKAVAPARPRYATAFPKPVSQSHTPIPPPQKKTPILPPGYTQSGARASHTPTSGQKASKPYEYKPRIDTYKGVQLNGPRSAHQSTPQQRNPYPYAFGSDPNWPAPSSNGQPRNSYGVQSQQMITASLPYPTTYYGNGQSDRTAYQNTTRQCQPSGHSASQSSKSHGSHSGHYSSHSQSGMPQQPVSSEKSTQKKPASRPSATNVDFNTLFMKYPYLRKEHNRPPTSYKSPYRQDGLGFCNGYEGDFKAHMAAQMAKDPNFLLKTPLTSMNRMNSHSSSQPSPAYEAPSKTYAPILPPPRKSYGAGQSNSSTPATLKQSPLGPTSQQNFTKPPAVVWEKKEAGLHPAIRQNAMFHQNYRPSSPSSSTPSMQQPPQQHHSQHSQGMHYSPSMRPENNGLNVHRSSMGAQNQYMSSHNSYDAASHHMHGHNVDWNRQYQQSPMTPQPSPAAHYYSNHSSRPSSSHRAPQPSPYLPTPTALATPTPAPPLGEEQRRFLQDCTPPARSFYSDGYHRSAGAPISKIIDDVPPPHQQQPQQKPRVNLQWQQPQVPQMHNRPVSREQPKQQQQQYQPPMQQQTQQQQQMVVDVPEFGPGSTDMMQTLFANLRSLAEQRKM